MAKYAGRKGVVYMSASGSGDAVAVIGLNAWSLNSPTDKIEVTEFGESNKTYVQGLPDFTGDLGGFWHDTSDALYDASRSTDGVKMYLYPSSDAPTKYWYGPAWVDFSISCNQPDAVTVSASWAANGSWGQL